MENTFSVGTYSIGLVGTGVETDGTIGLARPRSATLARIPTGMPQLEANAMLHLLQMMHLPPTQQSVHTRTKVPIGIHKKISALIHAKRQMFMEELDVVDRRDLMNPEVTKWSPISVDIMRVASSPCPRDGPACKTKWNQLISNYKKITYFFSRTGTNGAAYWDLTAIEKKAKGLPHFYARNVFYDIHEWFGKRPSMNPPHARDLLSNDDINYQVPTNHSNKVQI